MGQSSLNGDRRALILFIYYKCSAQNKYEIKNIQKFYNRLICLCNGVKNEHGKYRLQ